MNNLVHTFNMVQTDFGPRAVTLCDVICAAAAPSHRDPILDVNAFYNRDIDNLRAVADRLGVPVNKMYRGMQRRYTWESGDFGGNFCYTYHLDYRPTNSRAVTKAEKREIDATYRSSTARRILILWFLVCCVGQGMPRTRPLSPPTPPTSSSPVIKGCKQENTCECLAPWNETTKNLSFAGCQPPNSEGT